MYHRRMSFIALYYRAVNQHFENGTTVQVVSASAVLRRNGPSSSSSSSNLKRTRNDENQCSKNLSWGCSNEFGLVGWWLTGIRAFRTMWNDPFHRCLTKITMVSATDNTCHPSAASNVVHIAFHDKRALILDRRGSWLSRCPDWSWTVGLELVMA